MRRIPTNLKYVRKKINELTDSEYRACYNLNMGSRGEMRDKLVFGKHFDRRYHVFMLWNGDDLVAWALRFPDGEHRWSVYVYTRTNERRKGYGRWLVNESKRGMRSVNVYPWDNRSARFYSSIPQHTVYNKGTVGLLTERV